MAARTVMRTPVGAGTVRQGSTANVGALVLTQKAAIVYSVATAQTICIVPAGSQILEIYIDVTTAFNDSGTDLLDIGDGTTADLFLSAVSIAPTGRIIGSSDAGGSGGMIGWQNLGSGTADVTIKATYTGQNANASTGAATITVIYAVPMSTWN